MTEGEPATIIRLSGSADMQETDVLTQYLDKIFSQKRYHLVIDLSGLQFTSSMGLGNLIRAHTRCRDHQGRLALVNPQPAVGRILQITRLDRLFDIYNTVEEAMQAIGAQRQADD